MVPPGAAAPPSEIPPLDLIFDIDRNRIGLIVAATFGLTPALAIGALEKQIDNYKIDLHSTDVVDNSPI
jgi:hypothetical protein